jgi:hypothetical protein
MYLPKKSNMQNKLEKKHIFVGIFTKREGSGSGSVDQVYTGTVPKCHGSGTLIPTVFKIFNPSLLFCLTCCSPTCRKGKRYAFTHSATGETVTEVPPPAQNGIHPPPPSGIE